MISRSGRNCGYSIGAVVKMNGQHWTLKLGQSGSSVDNLAGCGGIERNCDHSGLRQTDFT